MRLGPQTLEEARKYRYGCWAGNEKGRAYRESDCAAEFIPNERGGLPTQCGRPHMKGSIWCAAHDPERQAKKEAEQRAKWAAQRDEDKAVDAEGEAILRRLGVKGHVLTHDLRPIRRLAIDFDEAAKLARRWPE